MPDYKIGTVAKRVGITSQTLRLYEKYGLIKPERKKKNRLYSENDIRWLLCLREMIHAKKISIEGVKRLLEYAPCWDITNCPEEQRSKCLAYLNRSKPCWELNKMICSNSSTSIEEKCKKCIVFLSIQKKIRKIP